MLLRTLSFKMVCYLQTPALIVLMSRDIPCIWRYLFGLLFIISHHKGKAKLSSWQRCDRQIFLFINFLIDLVTLFAVGQRDQLRTFTATLLVCELTSDTVLWPSTLHWCLIHDLGKCERPSLVDKWEIATISSVVLVNYSLGHI